jgi:hypothetical protein
MIDLANTQSRIKTIDQEDRALQRCNPSAWSMPEDGQEHMVMRMLPSSRSSFGLKAINLLSWCSAPTKAKYIKMSLPVGHMSGLYSRRTLASLNRNCEVPQGCFSWRRDKMVTQCYGIFNQLYTIPI